MSLLGRLKRLSVPPPEPQAPAPPAFPLDGYPDWAAMIAADERLWRATKRKGGPRVLVATAMGGFPAATFVESTLAASLALRGAEVELLLCDAALPACLQTHVFPEPRPQMLARYELPVVLCGHCHGKGHAFYSTLGLPIRNYSETLTAHDRAEAKRLADSVLYDDIPSYHWDGLPVGEHARAGALRYFAKGRLDSEPDGEVVLRRFFESALLTGMSYKNLLAENHFDVAILHHGIYVPQGIAAEACRKAGVRVVTWNVAYRESCFLFSHDDTYHHTMGSEPVSAWENVPWSEELEQETMDYLASRLTGARDWVWFHERPFEDIDAIARECGIDFSKPVVGLLTNVFWDAQLHYRASVFPDMLEWILKTIRWFETRPDLQLLVRIHPAEVRGTMPSRQPILAEIREAFPTLPKNVFVIPPESNSSTYAAMYKCDAVVIYGTKTGVELSSVGVPVIVAGEAWVRGKGVTRDATSEAHYYELLDELPTGERLTGATLERARKYAYHFFFRRMVPLPFMRKSNGPAPYEVNISSLAELRPGRWPGLDVICDGVLKGAPFVYRAEQYARRAAA